MYHPVDLERFQRPFPGLPQDQNKLGAQGSQILAGRNWKTGVFTPEDRYYNPKRKRPGPPMAVNVRSLSGFEYDGPPITGQLGGMPKPPIDSRAAGRPLSDDFTDAADASAGLIGPSAAQQAAAQEAMNATPFVQSVISQSASSTPVNYATVTAAPANFGSGSLLESIFSGFGSILGKTAVGVAQAKGAGTVRDAQIAAGVLPATPFSFTTPQGTPNLTTYAMIAAGLVGIYLLFGKSKKRK